MMIIPEIETDRLLMRGWREADLEPLAEFYADEDSARFVGGSKTRDLVWRAIASYIGHWALRGYGFWVLEEKATGNFAGWCGHWYPEGWAEPEIGWGLMIQMRGKGYATEAALAARLNAYKELRWITAISYIDLRNIASRRVADRLGAKPESETTLLGNPAIIYRHPAPKDLGLQ